jgi:hypothetical protein
MPDSDFHTAFAPGPLPAYPSATTCVANGKNLLLLPVVCVLHFNPPMNGERKQKRPCAGAL